MAVRRLFEHGGDPLVKAAHPAITTRTYALRRLARQFPLRCLADREDAVHEALCAAIRLGRADNRRAVAGWAARNLIGKQVMRGKVYSCRSQSTSTAGRGLPGADSEPVPPADWLDSSRLPAHETDMEGLLDMAAAASPQGEETAAEALRLLRAWGYTWLDIARMLGVTNKAVAQWAAGTIQPRASSLDTLRMLVARTSGVAEQPGWEADLARALKGRPAAALAAELGTLRQTVSRWVRGAATPGPEHVRALRLLALAC